MNYQRFWNLEIVCLTFIFSSIDKKGFYISIFKRIFKHFSNFFKISYILVGQKFKSSKPTKLLDKMTLNDGL